MVSAEMTRLYSEARTRLLIPGFHIGADRRSFRELGHWSARINQTEVISKRLTRMLRR